MTLLIATGVEHSGTGLLARILATSGLPVLHRAMPHVFNGREVWWDPDTFQPCRFVVITREPDAWLRSTMARGVRMEAALERRSQAKAALARISPFSTVCAVEYESLVADPDTELARLEDHLGVALTLPEPLYDANAKWRVAA